MTWEVNGSASCKNRIIDSCAQGKGVFFVDSETSLTLIFWFEGPATAATSAPDSMAETLLLPNKGVTSSEAV